MINQILLNRGVVMKIIGFIGFLITLKIIEIIIMMINPITNVIPNNSINAEIESSLMLLLV